MQKEVTNEENIIGFTVVFNIVYGRVGTSGINPDKSNRKRSNDPIKRRKYGKDGKRILQLFK